MNSAHRYRMPRDCFNAALVNKAKRGGILPDRVLGEMAIFRQLRVNFRFADNSEVSSLQEKCAILQVETARLAISCAASWQVIRKGRLGWRSSESRYSRFHSTHDDRRCPPRCG